MKIRRLLTVALALVILTTPGIIAQDDAHEDTNSCDLVYLFNGWARSAPAGIPSSAAYGLLVNLSDQEDVLVSASSNIAGRVELHDMMVNDDNVMEMRPVDGGIVIAPDGFVTIEPGGFHIMMTDLSGELLPDTILDITLTFENAGDVMVHLPVRDITEMDEMGMDMGDTDISEDADDMQMEWDEACAGMHLLDGFARPTLPGVANSAAYGLLLNLTGGTQTLTGVETSIAELAEIHEMTVGEDDMMQMRPLEDGLELPAGEAVLLQPGGYHMMLFNLSADLAVGNVVDLTLQFADTDPLTVTVPVRDPEMEAMKDMGGM